MLLARTLGCKSASMLMGICTHRRERGRLISIKNKVSNLDHSGKQKGKYLEMNILEIFDGPHSTLTNKIATGKV